MKVCLLSTKGNFSNKLGKGTQRYIYELWQNMSRMAKSRGVELTKSAPGFGSSELAYKVTFSLAVPFMPLWDYDIIHLPAPIASAPSLKGDAAIVTTATEFVELEEDSPYMKAMTAHTDRSGPSAKLRMSDFISRSAINQALASDYLITISSMVKDEAIRKGYDRKKIYPINLGVDRRFSAPKAKTRNRKFTLGYLGALNTRKNVKFAINAFKKTNSKDLDFKIYGRGSDYGNLVRQASVEKSIRFMDFAEEDKIVQIYDSFDAFIFPSLYEGFGLPILEAQARGLPVIVYKGATIPKEVRKYCIDAEDEAHAAQLIENLRKNGYNARTRKSATDYARSFTWSKCAEETIAAYKDIQKKRPSH